MVTHSRWLLMYGDSQQVASDVWCLTADRKAEKEITLNKLEKQFFP